MSRPILSKVCVFHLLFVICSLGLVNQVQAQLCGYDIVYSSYSCGTDTSSVFTLDTMAQETFTWSIEPAAGVAEFTVSGIYNETVSVDWNGVAGLQKLVYDTPACSDTIELNFEAVDRTLACNNLVNLSINSNCRLVVEPDMLIEGTNVDNAAYSVRLKDPESGNYLASNIVGYEFAGKTLVAEITHLGSCNLCWGLINVEDKNIPDLTCTNDTLTCQENPLPFFGNIDTLLFNDMADPATGSGINALLHWPLTGSGTAIVVSPTELRIESDSLCGPATLSYQDSLGANNCSDPEWSSIIYRKWSLSSESGSTNVCRDTIYIEKPDLDSIVWPMDFDAETALRCTDRKDEILPGDTTSWLALPNGHPDPMTPNYDMYPDGFFCNRLKATFWDERIQDCANASFKLIRTWTVLDWCTSEIADSVQLISVIDSGAGPIVSVPVNFEAPATYDCSDPFDMPAPTIDYPGCSPITDIKVGYSTEDYDGPCEDRTYIFTGVVANEDGTFTIPKLDNPSDNVWIAYLVSNECGQSVLECTLVTFKDVQEPIAVCDQHTVVGLNEYGIAFAGPFAFDDGSWDNCGIERFEVLKLNGSDCGEERVFGQKVKFCCEDIGIEVHLQLKVIDKAGFENICKAYVEVQDNYAPIILSCPEDVSVDCTADLVDLAQYGMPSFDGVCDFNVKSDTLVNINSCGVGTVTRVWRGVNLKGASTECRQVIYVGSLNPFARDSIDFPEDFEVDGCLEGTDLDPENLPPEYGLPIIKNRSCAKISFDYTDLVLGSTGESCVKILREWKVLDWCQYSNDVTTGYFIHNQVIKLHDDTAPEITSGCDNIVISDPDLDDNCVVDVELDAIGADDCTPEHLLQWSYTLENLSEGTSTSGQGNDASRKLGIGSHRVTWFLRDLCGNADTCSQMITVEDNKAPTPYCLGDIVTVLNLNTLDVTIWASDFVTGTADNCGPKDNTVSVAFSEDVDDTSLTVTCDSIVNGLYRKEVDIYAIDAAGNSTFCTAILVVQDNRQLCSNGGTEAGSADITGTVYTADNRMVEDVEVSIYKDVDVHYADVMTDELGYFAFPELEMYKDYMVEAKKLDAYNNGVSTLDLVLIQRHILGLAQLDSPYKIIAADANSSGSISAIDLVQLQKLILGIYDELPSSESWKFVDAEQQFIDETRPFPFEENLEHYNLEEDLDNVNFVAVKVGDVNGNVKVSLQETEVRSSVTNKLVAKNPIQVGQDMHIPIYLDGDKSIAGMQFTLDLGRIDNFSHIKSGQIKISQDNTGRIDESTVTFSWYSEKHNYQIIEDEPIFYLVYGAHNNENTSWQSIELNSSVTNAEMYEGEGNHETTELILEIDEEAGNMSLHTLPILYQNVPNPFEQNTTVRFYLPSSTSASFRVIDVTGKILYTKTDSYDEGLNELVLNAKDFNTQGVLYYQLETEETIINKRMILLK